jgi:hypothetical protein
MKALIMVREPSTLIIFITPPPLRTPLEPKIYTVGDTMVEEELRERNLNINLEVVLDLTKLAEARVGFGRSRLHFGSPNLVNFYKSIQR